MAWHLICSAKKGISSLQLQRQLKLGSYRTALFRAHRIRYALKSKSFTEKLNGTVEVDETFIGGVKCGVAAVSYRASQADLVLEKTALKLEKQRLQKTGSSYWNEPAKEFINTLETAGKMQIEKSPQEISQVVHKVETNRLISRKTVTFSFSEPYDFIPSLLASSHVTTSTTTPSLGDENGGSNIWCA